MTRVELTKDGWTEVFTGVSEISFNLVNYTDTVQKAYYKLTYATSTPAVDTNDFIMVPMDKGAVEYARSIIFKNSSAVNIYVMPVYADGALAY